MDGRYNEFCHNHKASHQDPSCTICDWSYAEEEFGLDYEKDNGHDRKVRYQPWMNAIDSHRWTFSGSGTCQECHQSNTQVITGGDISLCLGQMCLGMRRVRWWPTGQWRTHSDLLIRHLLSCTLHSSQTPTTPTAD